MIYPHQSNAADSQSKNDIQVFQDQMSEQQLSQKEFDEIAKETFGDQNKLTKSSSNINQLDSFGTVFFDSKDNKIVIGIAKDVELTKKLKDNIGKANKKRIKVVKVKYSTNELMDVKNNVFNTLTDFEDKETEILEVSLDSAANKIVIQAKKISEKVKKKLTTLYGDKIDFIIDEKLEPAQTTANTFREHNFDRLGGGIGIQTNSQQAICSTAATATKGSTKFIITAGHCIKNLNGTAYQYNKAVGTEHYSGIIAGNNLDIGLIRVTDTGRTLTNLVLKNGTSDYDAKVTSLGDFVQNQVVCKAGKTTDYTCGTVNKISTDINYVDDKGNFDFTAKDVVKIKSGTNKFCDHGDSGGVVWTSETLLGIVSGTANDFSYGYAAKINPYVYQLFDDDKRFFLTLS